MRNLKMRAIIASEVPEVRRLLTGVVQKDMGGVVAAQAENGLKALTLAKSLRPDVMLVDYRLPHVAGMDDVRLSRIGGLDTALAVSQELPNTRVMVVNDSSAAGSTHADHAVAAELCLYGESGSASVSFADLRVKEVSSMRSHVAEACDKATLVAGLSVLGGLGLMLSFIFAGPGAVLALAGGVLFLAASAVRAGAALWFKSSRTERDARETSTAHAHR